MLTASVTFSFGFSSFGQMERCFAGGEGCTVCRQMSPSVSPPVWTCQSWTHGGREWTEMTQMETLARASPPGFRPLTSLWTGELGVCLWALGGCEASRCVSVRASSPLGHWTCEALRAELAYVFISNNARERTWLCVCVCVWGEEAKCALSTCLTHSLQTPSHLLRD